MTGPTRGKSLELYFVDGKPDGLLTAEVFNWTGHILVVPRIQLGEALKRKEAQYAGVYILIGSQDNDVCVYIGESEDISARIKSHDISKDWWTKAILITSAANGLNKAHVRYLEARLVEEATEARKVRLENGNTPHGPDYRKLPAPTWRHSWNTFSWSFPPSRLIASSRTRAHR